MMTFKIVCPECGCDNCHISNVHNEYDEWIRITCPKCGKKEDV